MMIEEDTDETKHLLCGMMMRTHRGCGLNDDASTFHAYEALKTTTKTRETYCTVFIPPLSIEILIEPDLLSHRGVKTNGSEFPISDILLFPAPGVVKILFSKLALV